MAFSEKILIDGPVSRLQSSRYSGKASLLAMFICGFLTCPAAYGLHTLEPQLPSKVPGGMAISGVGDMGAYDDVPSVSMQAILERQRGKTGRASRSSGRPRSFYSQVEEVIPGINDAKQAAMPQSADPDALPVYVSGDLMEGYVDSTMRVEGRGQVIRDQTVLQGEVITYNRQTEVVTAQTDVHINNRGNVFNGSYVEFHLPTHLGYYDDVDYQIGSTGAHGQASRVDAVGQNMYALSEATYTLCAPDEDGKYAWIMTAEMIDLDYDADEGVAHNAVLRFMDTPILATPWMSFPLSNKRRSGLLVPSFSISDDNGFSYYQPYYWNIAPNYDATFTSMVMSKRGVGLGAEFRYLEPNWMGSLEGTFLPNDRLRHEDRWSYKLEHRQLLADRLDYLGRAAFSLDLNRVSDHNFWQDFPKASGSLMSRLLNNEGTVTTHNDEGVSTLIRVQRWQTLQDPDAYIVPPFDRTQMRMNVNRGDEFGFDLSAMGDVTNFESDDRTHSRVNGTRSLIELSASYPLISAGAFFIPRVKLISRYYDFENGIVYPQGLKNPSDDPDRTMNSYLATIPTFSIDSGLVFERQTNLFGRDYAQTLEPRAMYVYTPYRDQSMLPLYDTGDYDYNLATIYLDNPYSGYDRIADVNMMTVGVGTRWLEPQSGRQMLGLNVAQRIRFSDQRVTISGEPITSRYSDVLFSASTEMVPNWRFDALMQYDTDENRSQRSLLMARWKPGPYRVMNFGYRMWRGYSEQVDFSWQWPLGSPWFGDRLPQANSNGGRWYSVGRVNYSLRDKKLVDGILGLEYQGCCWIARVAFESVSTGRTEATTRVMFQLELLGLSRVGINPLQRLQDNIDHYQVIRNERLLRPNDFYLYD